MNRVSLRPYLRRLANTGLAVGDLLMPQGRTHSRPFSFHIEINDYCNLRCIHCPRHSPQAEINTGRWTEEMFDSLLPWMRYAGFVGIAGLGEPFLEKSLPRILKKIVNAGPAPSVITNGTLISREVIEQIVGVGPMLINVSIDGATRETFERIRAGGNFDRVIGNMMALREAKERAGTKHPGVQINWAWCKTNLGEYEELARIAEQIGALAIRTQPVYVEGLPQALPEAVTEAEVDLALANLRRVLNPAIQVVNSPINTPLIKQEPVEDGNGAGVSNESYFCPNIWRQILIGTHGNVRVCCMGAFQDIGNIQEQPLNEIWNGPFMVNLRKSLLAGQLPAPCRKCYLLKRHSTREAMAVLKEYREALRWHNLVR